MCLSHKYTSRTRSELCYPSAGNKESSVLRQIEIFRELEITCN